MPYSINIRSDHPTADRIRELWDRCAPLETQPSMRSLSYPPHITLAIYDDIEPRYLQPALGMASSNLGCITIEFQRMRYFDAPRGLVLWAEPSSSSSLVAAHDALHRLIGTDLCRPNYRPGAWVPHCTLATSIDESRRDEAIALSETTIEGFAVVFNVIDCARFYPVEVIHEENLPTASE